MLPLRLFASRQFSAANAVTFVVYAALGGLLFLVPTVLQVVHGYSPLASGTALLPVTVIMLVLSSRSGKLAARIGPRLQMSVGPLVIAASLVLFGRIGGSGDYLTAVLPAAVVFGFGVAIMVAPLTATALAAAPADHAGVASAVNNDVARAAGLIAVAVLPALAGITGTSYLHPAALARRVQDGGDDGGGILCCRRRAGRGHYPQPVQGCVCRDDAAGVQLRPGSHAYCVAWNRQRSPT